MIVYNITISVDQSLENEFIDWMRSTYIPMVLDTGHFYEHRFLRLVHQPEEGEGINFATQFLADTMLNMMNFEKLHANKIQDQLEARFAGRFVSFRSLLESVN